MSLRAFLPRPEGRGLTRILIKSVNLLKIWTQKNNASNTLTIRRTFHSAVTFGNLLGWIFELGLDCPCQFCLGQLAVLLSPSFKGETADTIPAGRTRFALCYGSDDRTIPIADQQCAREQLGSTGRCTYFEYPGMAHNICDQEIADVRAWLGL